MYMLFLHSAKETQLLYFYKGLSVWYLGWSLHAMNKRKRDHLLDK